MPDETRPSVPERAPDPGGGLPPEPGGMEPPAGCEARRPTVGVTAANGRSSMSGMREARSRASRGSGAFEGISSFELNGVHGHRGTAIAPIRRCRTTLRSAPSGPQLGRGSHGSKSRSAGTDATSPRSAHPSLSDETAQADRGCAAVRTDRSRGAPGPVRRPRGPRAPPYPTKRPRRTAVVPRLERLEVEGRRDRCNVPAVRLPLLIRRNGQGGPRLCRGSPGARA